MVADDIFCLTSLFTIIKGSLPVYDLAIFLQLTKPLWLDGYPSEYLCKKSRYIYANFLLLKTMLHIYEYQNFCSNCTKKKKKGKCSIHKSKAMHQVLFPEVLITLVTYFKRL